MDDLWLYIFLTVQCISLISRQWKGDNVKLCTIEIHLQSERFLSECLQKILTLGLLDQLANS